MDKQIQNIQKNMTTVFEGYVNGIKFTNRDEMNSYIGKCISDGTPINDMSYSSTTKLNRCPTKPVDGAEQICKRQNEISWIRYINELNTEVPKPYDTVLGYVIPFIHEDIFITSHRAEDVVTDFKNRLADRMTFMENRVFSQIRTMKYDISQVYQWLDTMIIGLQRKTDWCNDRAKVIEDYINNINDTLILNNTNVPGLKAFYEIYSEAGGFCSAMIDICKEMQSRIQVGAGA
jgi:hypothetical protein